MRRMFFVAVLVVSVPLFAGCLTSAEIAEKISYVPRDKIDAFVNVEFESFFHGSVYKEANAEIERAVCEFSARVFAKLSCGAARGGEDLVLRWWYRPGSVIAVELTDSKTRDVIHSWEFPPGTSSLTVDLVASALGKMAEQLVNSSQRGRIATWLADKRRVASTTPAAAPPPSLSLPPVVSFPPTAAAPVDLGRYHALVIGNQTYRHLPRLQTPVADTQALAALLRAEYGFASVTALTDATRTDMVRALDELRRTLTERDNLLVYYAGHGYLDRDADRGYWLPIDAESDNTANWLSNADIVDKLRALRAKHVLVVADSCFSGTLVRDVAIRPLTAPDISRLAQKRARTAITSGGLEPVSDVGGGGNSVFAKAFLEALRGVDGVVDMTTLFGTIRRQVLLHSQQTPQYSDVRQAGHDGGDFLFVRRR